MFCLFCVSGSGGGVNIENENIFGNVILILLMRHIDLFHRGVCVQRTYDISYDTGKVNME